MKKVSFFLPLVGIYVFLYVIFYLKGITALDPDFGWHIRMGQIILDTGIPQADPLSYTMAHYPVVDHEWLMNVIIAVLYPIIGMHGLAAVYAFVGVSSLMLVHLTISGSMRTWWFVPVSLAGATLASFAGVRAQVITWFFLAIILKFIFGKFRQWQLLVVPLVFVLWVNLHGAFASGIVLLAISVLTDILAGTKPVKKIFKLKLLRKLGVLNNVRDKEQGGNSGRLIMLALSITATFVNPYGLRIWWEVWMQISDQNLRGAIAEWNPSIDFLNFAFWALAALSSFLIIKYRSRYALKEIAVYGFLLIAALSSKRHITLWAIVASYLTTKAVYWLYGYASTIKHGRERFVKAYKIFGIICLLLFAFNLYVLYFSSQSASEVVYYPSEAAGYLRTTKLHGNLFAPYDWNGYLVWKVPGLRVFIDGMMPSWRYHDWEGESSYVFAEYRNILLGKQQLGATMKRYGINAIMVPSEEMNEGFFKDRKLNYDHILSQIRSLKLKPVYKDRKVEIYIRN